MVLLANMQIKQIKLAFPGQALIYEIALDDRHEIPCW
jgi:hypothetical protein